MRWTWMMALVGLMLVGCAETDVPDPGHEVEPVALDTLAWFSEGRTVTFNGRDWIVAGEPVYDPAVEHVGEFEGTPLYAEVGTASPYAGLYIPLEMDYWQRLEPVTAPVPAPTQDTGISQIR